ncbi:terpene synthase family protein [Streptomyces afghaniensis]|uniref:terpene synthase family protein n=1 Tax=Streptomyces afghaniensis TaxID=66865 RepID=UPI0033A5DD81
MDATAVGLPQSEPPLSELHPFYCPIEPAIHPEVDEVERRSVDWIDRLGFCRTPAERAWVLGSNSAEFYARFAPGADVERLWVAACWVYWGFAIDDARCDEGTLSTDPAAFSAMAGRVQRALETPGPRRFDDHYAAAIHDLGERFRACATPVQVRRFQQAHRAWLAGVQWQIGNRSRGHMPTLDDYVTMRLHSAGGEPTYAMLEIANGAEVPAREMDSPAVCALTEMAILVAGLDNDRHSLAKEAGRDQGEQNIFAVLMRQDGSPPARAAADAVALRDRVLRRFLVLRERVLPRASGELRRYLTDLGHGIRGNIEWGLRVPRYLSLASATAGPGEVTPPERIPWADHPLDTSDEPPPLPSITWWWDDLAF